MNDSMPAQFLAVADELARRAHELRVRAVRLDPKSKDRLRTRAAKLDRAARLLRDEAGVDAND